MPNGQDALGVDIVFGLALLATLFMIARRWRAFWDADFTPEECEAMSRQIRGAQFVRLDGAGHLANLERPIEFTAALA